MLVLSRPFTITVAAPPVIPAGTAVGGVSGSSDNYDYNALAYYSAAQKFTTSAPMTIDTLTVDFVGGTWYPGSLEMGIATGIGSTPANTAWVTDGTHKLKVDLFSPPKGQQLFPRAVEASMVLPAGTYYFVLRGLTGNGAADTRISYPAVSSTFGAVSSAAFNNGDFFVVSLGGGNDQSAWQNYATLINGPATTRDFALIWRAGQVNTTPTAPTSITTVAGDGRVSLSWTAPSSSGSSPITQYVIRAVANGTLVGGITSTTTSAVYTGLTNGTAYTFNIFAVNAAGNGTTSAVTSPVTPVAAATPTPTAAKAFSVDGVYGGVLGPGHFGAALAFVTEANCTVTAVTLSFGFNPGESIRLTLSTVYNDTNDSQTIRVNGTGDQTFTLTRPQTLIAGTTYWLNLSGIDYGLNGLIYVDQPLTVPYGSVQAFYVNGNSTTDVLKMSLTGTTDAPPSPDD